MNNCHTPRRRMLYVLYLILFSVGSVLLCSEPNGCASGERWLRTFVATKIVGVAAIIASYLILKVYILSEK